MTTPTSTSKGPSLRRVAFAIVLAGAVAVVLYMYSSALVPADSPLARMYRTESDLTLLKLAVQRYLVNHGEYPAPGIEGLDTAVAEYGDALDYTPDGAPLDSWDRLFVFVPYTAYGDSLDALRGPGGTFYAPDTFQLYSVGADGRSGAEDPVDEADNITSWDASGAWRLHYQAAQDGTL